MSLHRKPNLKDKLDAQEAELKLGAEKANLKVEESKPKNKKK